MCVGSTIYGHPPQFPESITIGETTVVRWVAPYTKYYRRSHDVDTEWIHLNEGDEIWITVRADLSNSCGISWEIVELHDKIPGVDDLPRLPWYLRILFWLHKSSPRAQLVDRCR